MLRPAILLGCHSYLWSLSHWEAGRCFGRLLGQRLGTDIADTTTHLFQRLSIRLWRGNAIMWVRRIPTRSAEVDGIR